MTEQKNLRLELYLSSIIGEKVERPDRLVLIIGRREDIETNLDYELMIAKAIKKESLLVRLGRINFPSEYSVEELIEIYTDKYGGEKIPNRIGCGVVVYRPYERDFHIHAILAEFGSNKIERRRT